MVLGYFATNVKKNDDIYVLFLKISIFAPFLSEGIP